MRYKNPTPLPASDEGAKMYLIKAETAVIVACFSKGTQMDADNFVLH
jgi:hypothetical protein